MENRKRYFGFQLLKVLLIICGQHLKICSDFEPRSKLGKFILKVYSTSLTIATFAFFVIGVFALFRNLGNFKNAIYLAVTFLSFFECFMRLVYTAWKKKKIESISTRLRSILYTSQLDTGEFAKSLAKVVAFLLIFLFTTFGISLLVDFLTIISQMDKLYDSIRNLTEISEIEKAVANNNASVEATNAWSYVAPLYAIWPSFIAARIYGAIIFSVFYLSFGRVLASDALFYTWYKIIIFQSSRSSQDLPQVLENDTGEETKLQNWIENHHSINDLLDEINSLTAPAIVIAVAAAGLRICIFFYMILRLYDDANVVSVFVYGITAAQQIFIYCILGQQIKNNLENLHTIAQKELWKQTYGSGRHAALIVCTTAGDNLSQSLPGTPFFHMSLHYLATIIGAVVTYFIVLMQLNKVD
ncbi:uncharacterized protein LOC132197681 isoform X2 [Neocloeon triangulifer]|nr:uncharacterized protein LOC132197681 isoform X2 [Neocloeon triangulifer]